MRVIAKREIQMANTKATRATFATLSFAKLYPMYVQKIEKKGRTKSELHRVITWLTGYGDAAIAEHIAADANFEEFFEWATLHPNAALITGVICGHRVEDIADPLIQQVRYLDKLVDELAKGRQIEKILR